MGILLIVCLPFLFFLMVIFELAKKYKQFVCDDVRLEGDKYATKDCQK